jgi:ubiquinone/menaquinone biosynthesis C-methylase UbiE
MFKDYFSSIAESYASYRPDYPDEIFRFISEQAISNDYAWDVATGNGQAAKGLLPYFNQIIATDASQDQIDKSFQHDRIRYRVAQAESSGVEQGSIDAITVAQAVHWFNLDAFIAEVQRVAKPNAIVAFWAYDLFQTNDEVCPAIDQFHQKIRQFWPKEISLVLEKYQTLPFPFTEVEPPQLQLETRWNLREFAGYVSTYSALRIAYKENPDFVERAFHELEVAWVDSDKSIRFFAPIYLRVGRVGAN